jgi:hypothetical protein
MLVSASTPYSQHRAGHLDAVQLLLKRNADPFMSDAKGENALAKCKDEGCRCGPVADVNSYLLHVP